MKKKLLSILLAFVMATTCIMPAMAAEGLSNFKKVNDYAVGMFTDVKSSAWYAENVQTAYELNLMKGNSGTTFNPSGNITLAETLAIACRLNNIYYDGSEEFVQGAPWYQVYVDYAVSHNIITLGTYNSYTAAATRAQFAEIIAASVPAEALAAINTVTAIPDVPQSASYAESVYLLYNAGILTGSDKYGTFKPESNISRSEVSAIITRIAATALRKHVVLEVKPIEVTGITLNKSSVSMVTGKSEVLTATVSPANATNKTVTWTSSNPKVATVSGGIISAVAEGTTKITATCGKYSAACTVTVTQAPMVYTGYGDKVVSGINLPKGAYYVEYTHDGRSNIIADLYYGDGILDSDLVANDIGVSSGRKLIRETLRNPIQNGMLEVNADGNWTISICKVSGKTSTNIAGTGDWVSGFFTAKQARTVCTYTNSGDDNFIVDIYALNGDSWLAANDIGPCDGQRLVTLTPGTTYFFVIKADGPWTIDLGYGDARETFAAPTAPSGGSGGSSSSGFATGDIHYYDNYPGVPDFGKMVGVNVTSDMGSYEGSYIYKSSEVYAAAGPNALRDYLNLLPDCGFTGGWGYSGDASSTVIYENAALGLTVRVNVTTISIGEYIHISIN